MNKPYITIKHVIVEIIGYVIWLLSLIIAIIGVVTGEGDIVTNYDFAGNPTGYGSRGMLLVTPILILSVLLMLSLNAHFAKESSYHFRKPIRPEKLLIAYSISVMMVLLLNIDMALFGLFITIVLVLGKGNLVLLGTIGMSVIMFAIIIGMSIKLEKDTK